MSNHKVILLATLLLWFSFSNNILAQGQKLTLNFNKALVSDVVKEIKTQTGLSVIYNSGDINPNSKISINSTNEPLDEVMKKFLSNTSSDLSYEVKDNYIVVSKKGQDANAKVQANKKKTVKGVVVDSNNEPLIGVNVVVEGTTTGTATDLDGNFSLSVSESDTELLFSYIGYESQLIDIAGKTNIRVVLREDGEMLDELVVTALGIKRSEKALSYNVQEVGGDDITSIKDANFMNALSGKVAGVNINASSAGIGGATRVVMRGPKSINQSNQALYVIDGVPMFNVNKGEVDATGRFGLISGGEGISDINPDDIENVTILSGPAAAALYGSSAAQGVIMITTKQGQEGKTKVTISNNSNFMSPFIMPEFQTRYMNKPNESMSWGTVETSSPYGNYNPKKFFNTGTNIQNTVSLTTGTEKNQTYLSVGTTNANGIIPNSEYNRYNFTAKNTTKFLKDKATLNIGVNYIIHNDHNLIGQGEYMNPLLPLYLFPRGENFEAARMYRTWDPGRGIYVQNWTGPSDMHMQNPYWIVNEINRESKRRRYMANASLKYEIQDWLDLIGRVRIDETAVDFEDKRSATTDELFTRSKYGYYGYHKSDERALYADVLLNIDKNIANFTINGNLGLSIAQEETDQRGQKGGLKAPANVFMPYAIDYAHATSENAPIFTKWKHRTNSIFASAELGYKNAYYLTLTGRNDWDSSLAGTKNSSFFYPSVGGSLILSEALKLPTFISFLKARGSWASVGSPIPRNLSSPYRYTYNPGTQSYVSESYLMPDEFYPERTYSWEAGLTGRFLNGLFNIDATLYKSNTVKQTFKRPISASGGYSAKYIQMGDVQNKGIELSLGVNKNFGDFNWESIVTYSANRNKIKELLEDPNEKIYKGGFNQIEVILKEGGTMGDLYVSVDLERDHEGNILVDGNDMVVKKTLDEPKYVGSVLPKGNIGWRNDFKYKNLNLGFMFSARFGGINVSTTQAIMDQYGVSERTALDRDNGGIEVNLGKIDTQKYYQVVGGANAVWSEYIYSATNIRLQEAYIGYNLPAKWFNDKANVNLMLTGRNLLMIYNKSPFDPELTASTGTYYQGFDYFMQPSLRSLGFALRVSF